MNTTKIKEHLTKHKNKYLGAAAVTVAAGLGAGAIAHNKVRNEAAKNIGGETDYDQIDKKQGGTDNSQSKSTKVDRVAAAAATRALNKKTLGV